MRPSARPSLEQWEALIGAYRASGLTLDPRWEAESMHQHISTLTPATIVYPGYARLVALIGPNTFGHAFGLEYQFTFSHEGNAFANLREALVHAQEGRLHTWHPDYNLVMFDWTFVWDRDALWAGYAA